jgi:YD repeat-containing protein
VITSRIVSPDGTAGSEQVWTYVFTTTDQTVVDGILSGTTKVTDPQGNSQVYARASYEALPHHVDSIDASGNVVKTFKGTVGGIGWSHYDSTTTILTETNQQSKSTFSYDDYGNMTEKDDTDWGQGAPGPVIRKTTYTYLADSNTVYAGDTVHILDRVTSEKVCDANNAFCGRPIPPTTRRR